MTDHTAPESEGGRASTIVLPGPPHRLVPEDGAIHVFWFSTDLPPSHVSELEPLLSPAERARADQFRFARDRGRYVAARARLRTILGRCTNRASGQLEFDTGPFGKPSLRPGGREERIRFNLSRSDGLGVVAIQLDRELGIDVERMRPFDHALAIAERMFTAAEHEALRSLPEAEQLESFFRYWTRKEAVVKSIGLGLAYPLDAFLLSRDSSATERVAIECDGVAAVRWVLPVPAPEEGFAAAVATAGTPSPMRCWSWTDD